MKCSICGKDIKNREAHFYYLNEKGRKIYTCHECGEKYFVDGEYGVPDK